MCRTISVSGVLGHVCRGGGSHLLEPLLISVDASKTVANFVRPKVDVRDIASEPVCLQLDRPIQHRDERLALCFEIAHDVLFNPQRGTSAQRPNARAQPRPSVAREPKALRAQRARFGPSAAARCWAALQSRSWKRNLEEREDDPRVRVLVGLLLGDGCAVKENWVDAWFNEVHVDVGAIFLGSH